LRDLFEANGIDITVPKQIFIQEAHNLAGT
jgi:hypothetical protein